MTEVITGTVTHVNGRMASVRVDQSDWCSRCGVKIWCQPEREEFGTISVQNKLDVQVGQRVLISEKSKYLLKISVLQYGIPLIGFVMGIVLVHASGLKIETLPAELCMFLGGVLGVILAGIFSNFWAKSIARKEQHYCEIKEIIG